MAFVMITRANQVPLKIVEECVTRRRSSVKGLFTLFSSILRPSFSHPSKQQQCNKSWKGSPFSFSSSSLTTAVCRPAPPCRAAKCYLNEASNKTLVRPQMFIFLQNKHTYMHAHGNNSISIKCRVKTFDYYTRQWREKVYNLMPQFCVSLLPGLLEERKKKQKR